VNRREAGLTVTVVEGKVDVVGKLREPAQEGGGAAAVEPLRVVAGEQVEVDPRGLRAQAIDARKATAWMRRDITFASRPLAEVTEELNRYLEKPIVLQDDGLRTLRVSGIFNAYDSESFLAFLRQYDVEIDARDDVIYVRARPKPAATNRQVIAVN
jgi:transmembrane sensor